MDTAPSRTSRPAAAMSRAGVAVTAANAAANVLAYLVPVLAARRLAPADLGALATCMALVAIATMPGIGLQTAVAVAVARSASAGGLARSGAAGAVAGSGTARGVARPGAGGAARPAWATAAACGAALLLATPLIAAVLRLPPALPPLLAAMTVPAVLAGWPLGVLQGQERFARLAAGTVLLAAARYAGVLAALAAGVGLTGAVALGALVAWSLPPALWWLARPFARPGMDSTAASSGENPAVPEPDAGTVAAEGVAPAVGSAVAAPASGARMEPAPGRAAEGVESAVGRAGEGVESAVGRAEDGAEPAGGSGAPAGAVRGRAVFAAASASLAILVASYADLILARRLLPPGESGAYAVGAVLTRAAIWAPQVITVLALPRLAKGRGAALRIGLVLLAAAGVALVAGVTVASGAAVRAVGGRQYDSLAHLAPWFVAVGALYAVTYFLLNAQLAAGARWLSAGVWAVVAALLVAAAVLRPPTVGALLACAVAASAASAAVTGAAVWLRRRRALTAAR